MDAMNMWNVRQLRICTYRNSSQIAYSVQLIKTQEVPVSLLIF